jgi:hypothetical protein
MKLLSAAGVAISLVMPVVLSAQKVAIPGQVASSPKVTSPSSSLPLQPYVPAVSSRPAAIAEVADDRHDKHMNTIWMTSIAAMLAATSADAISSWHKKESNSLLASSNGMFGARGIGIKAGIAAGVLLPQIILRKHKDLRAAFIVGNLAEAGVFTGAAVHNFRLDNPKH